MVGTFIFAVGRGRNTVKVLAGQGFCNTFGFSELVGFVGFEFGVFFGFAARPIYYDFLDFVLFACAEG